MGIRQESIGGGGVVRERKIASYDMKWGINIRDGRRLGEQRKLWRNDVVTVW